MKRCVCCYALFVGTVFLVGCRQTTVEQNDSSQKPATPTAELGTADVFTNVSLPMPGADGGPLLPELPKLDENGRPQLPALPGLPGEKDGPLLPSLPDLPEPPHLQNAPNQDGELKLPSAPELPQLPANVLQAPADEPISQAHSEETPS